MFPLGACCRALTEAHTWEKSVEMTVGVTANETVVVLKVFMAIALCYRTPCRLRFQRGLKEAIKLGISGMRRGFERFEDGDQPYDVILDRLNLLDP